jgi:membrane protein YqaA with SNARE-associated domain
VFILAALDSSVMPTLGAVDALTVVLASLHPERWPYYTMCSTAGSVCGASAAYRLSRLGNLHRRPRIVHWFAELFARHRTS